MASLRSEVAKELFSVLKSWGKKVTIFDNNGNVSIDPTEAASFFVDPDKSLVQLDFSGDDSAINLYLSDMFETEDLLKFLDSIRSIANRANMLFNVKKYNKEIAPKDFAHKFAINESMWGSTKSSYQNIGNCKLIVRHSANINEEISGSRSRRIRSIYIETKQGERFLFPTKSLRGARALANHLSNGGERTDHISNLILSDANNLSNLRKIKGLVRRKGMTDADLIEELDGKIDAINRNLLRLHKDRYYTNFVENIKNEETNVVGPFIGDVEALATDFSDQLGLTTDDAFNPIVLSLASSILGKKQMANFDFADENVSPVIVLTCENELTESQLYETLVDEFGFVENQNFIVSENKFFILDPQYNSLMNTVSSLHEGVRLDEATDKFYTYALHWLTQRSNALASAGEHNDNTDLEKQATELATGLKALVTGNLTFKVKKSDFPKFNDRNSDIAYKLSAALKSGIRNDVLFNFISELAYKLGHSTLNANEAFFAKRVADLVDKSAIENNSLPEENEIEEWAQAYIDTALIPPHEREIAEEVSETDIEKVLETFDVSDFLATYGDMFDGYKDGALANLDVDDRRYAKNYIINHMEKYIEEKFDISPLDIVKFEYAIDDLFDSRVKPVIENLGVIVENTDKLDETLFTESDDIGNGFTYSDALEVINEIAYSVLNSAPNQDVDAFEFDPAGFIRDVVSEIEGQVEAYLENNWDISGLTSDSDIHETITKIVKQYYAEKFGFELSETLENEKVDQTELDTIKAVLATLVQSHSDEDSEFFMDALRDSFLHSSKDMELIDTYEPELREYVISAFGVDESYNTDINSDLGPRQVGVGKKFIKDVEYIPDDHEDE